MYSRNIAKVFYPTGAAYGLTVRCAAAWHGPSRELGPCAKLDGLSCMHQLFPGREPHQLYFVALERGILCIKAKNRCPCRTLPANRRAPGHLTVLSLGASGAGRYSRLRLKCSRWRWWFYRLSSAFVRCLRSKARWCSKQGTHLISFIRPDGLYIEKNRVIGRRQA